MPNMPGLSADSWKAAQLAAQRAIPRLMAKGLIREAANPAHRAEQFGRFAQAAQHPQE